MKPFIVLLAIVLGMFQAAKEQPAKPAVPKPADSEQDRFHGTWDLGSLIRDGKEVGAEMRSVQLIFDQGQYTYKDKSGEVDHGSFTVNSSAKPKEIETVRTDKTGRGLAMIRIYQWIDKDTLRFCSPGKGEARPATFDAPAGSGRELSVWKRQKP